MRGKASFRRMSRLATVLHPRTAEDSVTGLPYGSQVQPGDPLFDWPAE